MTESSDRRFNKACLTQNHELGLVSEVKTRELRDHLTTYHRVIADPDRLTRFGLGKAHLLAHAVAANPDLEDIVRDWVDESW